jgi:outer membrane protein assembly factor BamA
MTPNRIAHIFINGNKITKPYVIMAYCDFDTGMAYDSLALQRAERRLRATRIFLNVNLLSLRENDGYDIYILVTEYPLYLTFPPVLGLNRYFWLHHDEGSWYCPQAGMELINLGGREEDLGVAAQVGVWQNYAAFWTKPLFPSKYYIGISTAYSLTPDGWYHWDLHEVTGGLTIGRRFFESSKGYCSIQPDYRWVTDSLGGDSVQQHQVYAALGWISDLRSSGFDPSSGTWFQLETRSNYPYHDSDVPPYVQFTSDIKWYIPFLFRDAKFAFHLYTLVRTSDATYFDRVLIGGINSVRGYTTEDIGLKMSANDACTFSCEYRFPLYRFPPISELMPENYAKMLGRFSEWAPRLDGALIGDWGRVATTSQALIGRPDSAANQTGSGIGFGLRLTEPTLKLTVCSDFIWSESLLPGGAYQPRLLWYLYSGINF